jgi:hypothetical protein
VIFRNPAAWIGLALLLVPIAIHLLVRAPAQPIVVASLRFVRASPMRALRRRLLNDGGLLALRVTLLVLAVAAFANPLVTTACRARAWNARLFRAVVHETRATGADVLRAQNEPSAFATRVVAGDDLRHGLARANAWLALSPPGKREIVVVGHLALGALDEDTVRETPAAVGVRFVRTGTIETRVTLDGTRATRRADEGLATVQPRVSLDGERTIVTPVGSERLPSDAIEPTRHGWRAPSLGLDILGPDAARPVIHAALAAALAVGAPMPTEPTNQPITMLLGSAPPGSAPPGSALPGSALPGSALLESAPLKSTAPGSSPGRVAQAARVAPIAQTWMAAAISYVSSDPDVARESRGVLAATREPLPAPWLTLLRDAEGHVLVGAAASPGPTSAGLLVWARVEPTSPLSPALVRSLLASRMDAQRLTQAEVLPIPDAQLAAWSRPPADVDQRGPGREHASDRTWFWAAVLAVLGVETLVRRRRGVTLATDEGGTRDRAA